MSKGIAVTMQTLDQVSFMEDCWCLCMIRYRVGDAPTSSDKRMLVKRDAGATKKYTAQASAMFNNSLKSSDVGCACK